MVYYLKNILFSIILVDKFSDGLAGWYIIGTMFKFLHVERLRILPSQTSGILKLTVG